MPELPDVEIFKRYFTSTCVNQKISDTDVIKSRLVKGVSGEGLRKYLKNKKFTGTERLGKNFFAHTDGGKILRLHFGMTGSLKYYKNDDEKPGHTCLLIHFENGYKMAYICQRLFGEISLEESINKFAEKNDIGIDAGSISPDQFGEIVKKTKKSAKSLLMDQSKIAGLGNIYADEVLFKSKIHPKTPTTNFSDIDIKNVYKNIEKVVKYAIDHKAEPKNFAQSYLLPHRGKGEKCPRCKGKIDQIKISGRTTYYCPICQVEK